MRAAHWGILRTTAGVHAVGPRRRRRGGALPMPGATVAPGTTVARVPLMDPVWITVDGNEAAASVAHRVNEVIAIYPITPSSPMGELARRVVGAGRHEHLGPGADGHRDAVRGRRGRRRPRRAAGRRAGDDVHRVAGPAADDPEHVQDRRRADAVLHARRGPHRGHARAVDLRRPLGRDGLPADRLRDAALRLGAGGAGLRAASPRRRRCAPACRSCTSSTASAPRTRSPRSRRSTTTCCGDDARRV